MYRICAVLQAAKRALALSVCLFPALSFGLLPASAAAQASHQDTTQQRLQQLLEQQRAAIQSGDNAAVVTATQRVIAAALQGIADIRLLQREYPQAIDIYRQAAALDDSAASHVDLAVALFRSRKQDEALAEVDRVLATDPRNARAWQLKGSLQMASGDYKDAVPSLVRSLDLVPDVNAQYALGFSLLKTHDKARAAKVFDNMLAQYGDKAVWHVIFGGAYRDTEYLDDAVVQFKRAIALDPHVPHGYFFLGLTYLQINQWGPSAEALASFQQALRFEPRDYLVNFYLGALESTEKHLADSDQHLHLAATIQPRSPETWLYLGLNAFEEQKDADAQRYLHECIETTGTDDGRNNYQVRRAYFVLGRIAAREGRQEEARQLMLKVKQFQQAALGNSADTIASQMQTQGMESAPAVVPALASTAPHDALEGPAGDGASADTAEVDTAHPAGTDKEQAAIAEREARLRRIAASGFNDLGTAAARQHQYADALVSFHEAERWDPATPGLPKNIGLAAFRQQDFKESARALQKVVDENPADERSRLMLAMSLFSLEQFKQAASQFAPVAHAAMADPRAAYAWAYSLAQTGQAQQANQIADTLEAESLPPDVLSLVCHLYSQVQNYEHSVTCYRHAYQQYPTLQHAHSEAGLSLLHLDRPQEAVPELQQELTLSPNDPEVQYQLAFALLQTSHKDEATQLLRTVIQADPHHAEAQYQFGKLMLEDNKVEEAIQHLEIAEQVNPATDYVHYQLQIAYRKAGRTEDAEREVKAYREIKAKRREVQKP